MSEEGNNQAPAPIASGGGSSALDMTSEKDRGMVRTAIKRWPKRWRGLDDSTKEEFVGGLVEASRIARSQLTDPDNCLDAAKALGSIVKTAVAMEAQNQADEHLEDKNDRLDAGKATENVSHNVKYLKGVDGGAL